MSIWDWVYDYEENAESSDDPRRQRLGELRLEADSAAETDPLKALALREQGRDLAEQLGEKWWMLFFDHWRLQSLIHGLGDLKTARDVVMEAIVEARKPVYSRLPQRICLYEEFILVHVGMDARRYASEIRAALEYMKSEVVPGSECEACSYALEADIAFEERDFEAVEQVALRLLALTDQMGRWQQNHERRRAYGYLACAAHQRQDWQKLQTWSEAGLAVVGEPKQLAFVATFTVWNALASYNLGNHEMACDLVEQATSLIRHHNLEPYDWYLNALIDFHIARNEPELALEVHREQLADLVGKHRWTAEYRSRVVGLRLLAQLGQPLDDELRTAEALSQKLQHPDPSRHELREIAQKQ